MAVDKAIGNATERLVRAHHARRLHKLRHESRLKWRKASACRLHAPRPLLP